MYRDSIFIRTAVLAVLFPFFLLSTTAQAQLESGQWGSRNTAFDGNTSHPSIPGDWADVLQMGWDNNPVNGTSPGTKGSSIHQVASGMSDLFLRGGDGAIGITGDTGANSGGFGAQGETGGAGYQGGGGGDAIAEVQGGLAVALGGNGGVGGTGGTGGQGGPEREYDPGDPDNGVPATSAIAPGDGGYGGDGGQGGNGGVGKAYFKEFVENGVTHDGAGAAMGGRGGTPGGGGAGGPGGVTGGATGPNGAAGSLSGGYGLAFALYGP